MRYRLFISLLVLVTTLAVGQDKYLIYFKDKGDLADKFLAKKISNDNLAEKLLSERSIERRKKVKGNDYFNTEDLPLEKKYVESLKKLNIKIIHKLKWFNAVSAFLNSDQIKKLNKFNFIKNIEKVRKISASEPVDSEDIPNRKLAKFSDTNAYNYGSSLEQNELSDIPEVHNMGFNGEGVIIGLLDTGFDWKEHIALKDRFVIAERDFIYNDNVTANDTNDVSSYQHNHGTSVFSIIAGFDEGNLVGPAFNSQYLLAKTEFVPTETHSEEDNYAAALEWMDSIGVDITSTSLGYSDGFDRYDEENYTYEDMDGKSAISTKAAEMAFDRGIVVITSAGNEGNTPWQYITAPADGINSLAVGAVSSSNIVTSFSSEGPTFDGRIKPEIVAMGATIMNARAGTVDSYGLGSGTSYSGPIAAGIAALLLNAHPHLNNQQVRSILIQSGDNLDDPNNERGYGLVSALKAVSFPNLEMTATGFRLHKIFPLSEEIDEFSVEAVFDDSLMYQMDKVDKGYYVDLPLLASNREYKFYFKYSDLNGNGLRHPVDRNYKMNYGGLNIILGSEEEFNTGIPSKYQLYQNYPNPFNPDTRISYYLPETHTESRVTIKLFNILGAEVRTILDEFQESGNYSVDFSSVGLSSGVYFYQLQTGSKNLTKKLMILK